MPFILGLIAAAGATSLLCVGSSISILAVGRLLQGCAASLVWTVGLALLVDSAGAAQLGAAMGFVTLGMSLGFLLAPLLGGLVYYRAGYYPVYAMVFGLLLLDAILRVLLIERDAVPWPVENKIRQDTTAIPPQDLETAASTTSCPGVRSPRDDVEQPVTVSAWQNTQQESHQTPLEGKFLSKLKPLYRPRMLASLLGTLVQAAVTTALDSTLPLQVTAIFGWSSLGAGLIFIPLLLPSFAGPIIGVVNDRIGSKALASVGFLLAVPCLACLRFVTEDSLPHKVLLCALLVGVGLAMALVLGPLMADIAWSIEADTKQVPGSKGSGVYAQAYALMNMAFSAGALVGPIFGGLVRNRAGWAVEGWSLALLCGVTAIPVTLLVGNPASTRAPGRN